MSEPKITPIGEPTTTVVLEYAVQGADVVQELYGARPARIDPQSARVTIRDGEIVIISVVGRRILKSGKDSGPFTISFGWYSLKHNEMPGWIRELAESARLRTLAGRI